MGKAQPVITKAFKQEAVQIAKDLGVSDSALSRWVRDSCVQPAAAFPGKGHLNPADEEVRRLTRENDVLCQEHDILKKPSPSSRTSPNEVSMYQ